MSDGYSMMVGGARMRLIRMRNSEYFTAVNNVFNLVPRVFVPYCACWSRGTRTLETRVKSTEK